MSFLMTEQRCYNRYCAKVLSEEDFPTFNAGKYHLCAMCWAAFDGQKMRGRFRSIGMSHEDLVRLFSKMDQECKGGCPFSIGDPSDEERYTEDMDEWIEWQGEKEEESK